MRVRVLAARRARGLRSLRPSLRRQRAQGRPGARCTRGLVCNVHKGKRTRAYRFSGNTPAFPAQRRELAKKAELNQYHATDVFTFVSRSALRSLSRETYRRI